MTTSERKDALYTCAKCPDGENFDRLKEGSKGVKSRCLEYHIRTEHPEDYDDWETLIGQLLWKVRSTGQVIPRANPRAARKIEERVAEKVAEKEKKLKATKAANKVVKKSGKKSGAKGNKKNKKTA